MDLATSATAEDMHLEDSQRLQPDEQRMCLHSMIMPVQDPSTSTAWLGHDDQQAAGQLKNAASFNCCTGT